MAFKKQTFAYLILFSNIKREAQIAPCGLPHRHHPPIPESQSMSNCQASEMIAAFNANGSLAHLLFSPGSSVLQSVKRPLSYNSAKTNLRLQGDISPLNFLLLHPPCLSVCSHSASICPGRREPNGEDEMASQLWCCQTARDGVYCVTND